MTDTTNNQYTIPMSQWADFQANMAKLNRKAVKLGCEPITWDVLGEGMVERTYSYKNRLGETVDKKVKVQARTIDLHGTAPKLEGFLFVARIEYLQGGLKLFHQVPGAEVKVDERFRALDSSVCEHCNKRRNRTDSFVVMACDTGVQTQVGRQCLADFTGINDPARIAGKAQWLAYVGGIAEYIDMDRMWGRRFEDTLDAQHVLALTSAYIARVGWTPRSAASDSRNPTASDVGSHFWGTPVKERERAFLREMEEAAGTTEHQERAERVLRWVRTELADKARSDYELNLVTLMTNDVLERKHLGLVCSAVAAWQRANNMAVEYAKKRERHLASTHVGIVGERMRGLPATIEHLRSLEGGQWGPRTLVKFVDAAGNVLTWFASGDHDYVVGQQVVIDGTVKKHDEYQGVKQTVLSRVAVHQPKEA